MVLFTCMMYPPAYYLEVRTYIPVIRQRYFTMLYAFFWAITRRLEFICRSFGTLCLFHLHRQVNLPACEDGTECSETSGYKLQTPGNYPKKAYNIVKYLCRITGI